MLALHMTCGAATGRTSKRRLVAANPVQMIWTRSHLARRQVPWLPTHQVKSAPGRCPPAGRLDKVSVVPLALHPSLLQVGPRRDGMGVHHLQEKVPSESRRWYKDAPAQFRKPTHHKLQHNWDKWQQPVGSSVTS